MPSRPFPHGMGMLSIERKPRKCRTEKTPDFQLTRLFRCVRNRTFGAAYGLWMLFSLRAHRAMFASAKHDEDCEAPWPMVLALATLTAMFVTNDGRSTWFVDALALMV